MDIFTKILKFMVDIVFPVFLTGSFIWIIFHWEEYNKAREIRHNFVLDNSPMSSRQKFFIKALLIGWGVLVAIAIIVITLGFYIR